MKRLALEDGEWPMLELYGPGRDQSSGKEFNCIASMYWSEQMLCRSKLRLMLRLSGEAAHNMDVLVPILYEQTRCLHIRGMITAWVVKYALHG